MTEIDQDQALFPWHLFIDGELYTSAQTLPDLKELRNSLRDVPGFRHHRFEYRYGSLDRLLGKDSR
ncbi:hypothetical protein CC117_00750 [Parafrankia colletiae]|uniref:Uncharacterized protein n=1 Tax=Parafrankia colletiae TaxID=573497 RepID=A0A1S1RHG3_9ACTN|nr:hypothetical protein [Parafrankia colletiae]MCK9904276.1 hypothetical protein [Frankia sp. Cpl3]OHV46218.1 hypothetical protein CC117_00750 [Parafrankia colletiae]